MRTQNTEFLALQASLVEALKNAELYKAVIPGNDLVGKMQFCSDTTCRLGTTDENDAAVFKIEEAAGPNRTGSLQV